MKKKITCFLIACGMMFTLSACGGPFTCGLCGKEKTGKSHSIEEFGKTYKICDDCYTGMKELADALMGLG